MLIKSIYLKKYKPFALNEIEEITIHNKESFNLILGTNGSGKTSLLRQMNPLPAIKRDFLEGGVKRVELSHKGIDYLMTSTFENGTLHSLIDLTNNIELNKASTATVQRELVEDLMNYTPMVHKLLIGDTKFTDMNPSMRREFLSMINPSDLTYALKRFDEFKVRQRDTQGVLKHVINKSRDAMNRMETIDYSESIIEEKHELESVLDTLAKYTHTDDPDVESVQDKLDEANRVLEKVVKSWEEYKPTYSKSDEVYDQDSLTRYVIKLEGKVDACQRLIDVYNNNILESDELSRTGTHNTSTSDLNAIIDTNEELIGKYNQKFLVNANHNKYLTELTEFDLSYSDLVCYNGLKYIPKDEREKIKQDLDYTKDRKSKLLRLIDLGNDKLSRITQSIEKVKCPSCEFKFKLYGEGGEDDVVTIKDKLQILDTKLVELNNELSKLNEAMIDVADLEISLNKFRNLRKVSSLPKEFWGNLPTIKTCIETPTLVHSYVLYWRNNLTDGLECTRLSNEISSAKTTLKLLLLGGGKDTIKVVELKSKVEDVLIEQKELRDEIVHYKTLQKTQKKYNEIISKGEKAVEVIGESLNQLTDISITKAANVKKTEIYDRLTIIRKIVSEKENLALTLRNLGTEQSNVYIEFNSLKLLTNAMSPNTGIIADQMLNFINSFIEQMNKVFAIIYSYELSIGVEVKNDNTLTYKFPLKVENETVPEINMGSKGQCEVINLAFILVTRVYLGLEDHPMYLDEPGEGFDDVHKDKLIYFIKNLVEDQQCSQLFMINHDPSIYGAIANKDVVILDDRNIVVPGVHNENVVIKHNR